MVSRGTPARRFLRNAFAASGLPTLCGQIAQNSHSNSSAIRFAIATRSCARCERSELSISPFTITLSLLGRAPVQPRVASSVAPMAGPSVVPSVAPMAGPVSACRCNRISTDECGLIERRLCAASAIALSKEEPSNAIFFLLETPAALAFRWPSLPIHPSKAFSATTGWYNRPSVHATHPRSDISRIFFQLLMSLPSSARRVRATSSSGIDPAGTWW